ncbi:MAG: DNRLRE domain-containing protein [Polyangiaceae bacterium]
MLGRCREPKTMPVSTDATRLELEPKDFAMVGAEGLATADTIGESIVFGRAGETRELWLRFALDLPDGARVQRALLVLDALPECRRRPGLVSFEVAQILERWSSASATPARRPRTSLPMRAGELSVTPPQPLRLDVTELVRAWRAPHAESFGLALRAEGSSESGACFSSGLSWGKGPRLVVFLWPEEDGAGGGGGAGGGEDGGGGAGGSGGASGEGGARG